MHPDLQKIQTRFTHGFTSMNELDYILKHYKNRVKKDKRNINLNIEYQSFKELSRRLKTSVFSEEGKSYPPEYKRFCIRAEFHNTLLFINSLKKILSTEGIEEKLIDPKFYGQKDSGYKLSIETIIHIFLRHNKTINSFINKDSKINGYHPASFNFGTFTGPISILFMALNVLSESDWEKTLGSKNLICHINIAGQEYTIVRNGSSKEILSFYPRNDGLQTKFIELIRDHNKMILNKK